MAALVGTNQAGVSGNVRAPVKAEKENVGEGVPSSRTEKPKELSSLTPLGEASFKGHPHAEARAAELQDVPAGPPTGPGHRLHTNL